MKKLRYDLLLIAAVLLAAGLLWWMTRPGEQGGYAVVTIDGREVGRFALSQDREITFGDGDYNTLCIADGMVSVTAANCGDHTCVRTGRISREGERIVCLPHKMTVAVVGGGSAAFDAVS